MCVGGRIKLHTRWSVQHSRAIAAPERGEHARAFSAYCVPQRDGVNVD